MMENQESNDFKQLSDLKPKMHLNGVVTKIELFGAFVDVGLDTPGLVHISKIRREPLKRIQDVLQEGQEIEVWVERVDPAAGRLELSLIKPVQLDWKDIKQGMKLTGEVVRLEKFGAFIDIGAVRPGLVHVSEMSSGYVSDPSELVKVGDQVEVVILDFDRKKRQIKLSMKMEESVEDFLEEDETEEVPATAMEVALRKALEEQTNEVPPPPKVSPTQPKKQKNQNELEDILSRTLEQRVKSSSDSS
jgi:small subunit ribosomal protein S1